MPVAIPRYKQTQKRECPMAVMLKCKMCGGDLLITEGNTIATCEYCGSLQTVPTLDNEKKLSLFARANKLRAACDFDKAAAVYESIIAEFPEEAEGYWGLVLCKYGIEYVDDPATGKKIPTCHRSSYDSVMDDTDLEQAVENADVTAQKVYRAEAKAIEQIRKGILEVSSKEEPYDIFICYKETDEKGDRTLDSMVAQDIYDALTEKGYRVFFSRITLEDKLGVAYEPYIFSALHSSKVMLAVGTCFEHYNAVWVKNEWSRYLKLCAQDKSKHLIPCFKDLDAYDIPKEFRHLQAQDMGKVGALADLVRGIDKMIVAKPAPVQPAGVQTDDVNRLYIYNSALEDIKKKKVDRLKDAVNKLRSLGDWQDASARLMEAEKKLKKAKRNRAIIALVIICAIILPGYMINYSIKESQYEQAQRREAAYQYYNAKTAYEALDNFKDSKERAAEMDRLMQATENEMIALASYWDSDIKNKEKSLYLYLMDHGDEYVFDQRYTGSFFGSEKTLESFLGTESFNFHIRYDFETEEYLLIDEDILSDIAYDQETTDLAIPDSAIVRLRIEEKGKLIITNSENKFYRLNRYFM